jgi:DNA-binding NtrC family response regulator
MIERTKATLSLPLDRRRILLVEDDSQLLSTLSSYLFRAGAWDVWQAHSCARARELWTIHAEQIDVVIVDIHLGDGNGLDLLNELTVAKAQFFGLVISGRPVLEQHPVQFLRKPFTEEMLISTLSNTVW